MRILAFCFFTFISLTQATGLKPVIQNTWGLSFDNFNHDYSEMLRSDGEILHSGYYNLLGFPAESIPYFFLLDRHANQGQMITMSQNNGSAGLSSNGKYYTWETLAPGDGTNEGVAFSIRYETPMEYPPLSAIPFVAIESKHGTMALDSAGDIWMWGDNSDSYTRA